MQNKIKKQTAGKCNQEAEDSGDKITKDRNDP